MKSYKCQKCEFIFSDAEKIISDATPAGVCPKCFYPLTDYDAKLNNLVKQAIADESIFIDENNPNYFKCANCFKLTHIHHRVKQRWYVFGLHGMLIAKYKGICDECIYQLYFLSLVIYIILFSMFIWPVIHKLVGWGESGL
jgi:Zn finger protein HypA/HybF involved in hydrogenase expression